MKRNKIINGILLAGMLFCIIYFIWGYIQYHKVEQKAIVVLISCFIALLKPGKAPPPFEYYREHYDLITPDTFQDKNKSETLRMGIYWFNRKKYRNAAAQFDQLLAGGDLYGRELKIVKLLKENCALRMSPGKIHMQK